MKALDLETAMLILEKFDAVSVVDTKGEYIYANENWLHAFHKTLDQITGMHPWDILPDTQVRKVLETHNPIIAYNMKEKNVKGFVSYYPIMNEGKFFGVLIWVFYTWMETAIKFSQMVSELSRELESTKATLRTLSSANYSIQNIIGESPSIIHLREDIAAAGRTSSTVLIDGETGVGKELVAHSIHDCSLRHNARFVRVNCSAIPNDLMESEFFGYEEGSFTGAKRGGKEGKFELASGGSLFLDEVNQLPLVIQPKFLRVLQEREIERVGGKDEIPVDARIIAATNVPLETLVREGTFRSDLYYRLNVIRIRVPPLRERKEDIPLLTRNLVAKLNHQMGLDISGVDDEVLDLFMNYDWPGNIRELQNVLESAMNRANDNTLRRKHLRPLFSVPPPATVTAGQAAQLSAVPKSGSLLTMKADMEYDAICDAMSLCRGNKTEAAAVLGISRNALYKKLRKYRTR